MLIGHAKVFFSCSYVSQAVVCFFGAILWNNKRQDLTFIKITFQYLKLEYHLHLSKNGQNLLNYGLSTVLVRPSVLFGKLSAPSQSWLE